MATSLNKSIKECIESRDKRSVERLFDRVRSAVEEFVRREEVPAPYCYLDQKNPINSFALSKQPRK